MNIRVLSGEDVAAVLPMTAAIDLMRNAFVQLSAGEASIPLRTRMDADESGGCTLVMPGHVPSRSSMGIKVVSVHERNSGRQLPTIHAIMVLVDADTGQPVALLEAERLTAIRTGAASGLATDLLSHPDARVVAVIGAGRQAETQLEAVAAVRKLDRAMVFARTAESALGFSARMSSLLDIEIHAADSQAQLREADIICTATTSSTPVFDAVDVKAGTHINAVGSFGPDAFEIPLALVARSDIVVDQREACFAEAGEIVQAICHGLMDSDGIVGELGEVAAGSVRGRSSRDAITLFKSVGNAVQDIVTASFVVERAEEAGLGSVVAL